VTSSRLSRGVRLFVFCLVVEVGFYVGCVVAGDVYDFLVVISR
jgi:hypothetical protein